MSASNYESINYLYEIPLLGETENILYKQSDFTKYFLKIFSTFHKYPQSKCIWPAKKINAWPN